MAFLALPWLLSSQEYIAQTDHWGVEQGLSHRQVEGIYEDSRGYFWIATPNGLNRFDGYSFKQYTKENSGFLFNDIQNICEDTDGWLWLIGHLGVGVFLFHPDRNQVMTFEEKFGSLNPEFKVPEFNKHLDNFRTFQDGTLIFENTEGTRHWRYQPSTGIQEFPLETNWFVHFFAVSRKNTIWAREGDNNTIEIDYSGHVLRRWRDTVPCQTIVGSPDGLFLEPAPLASTNQLIFVDLNGKSRAIDRNTLPPNHWPIYIALGNTGLLITNGALIDFDNGAVLARWEFPFRDKSVTFWRRVMVDKKGRVWFGDDFGLHRLQIKPNKFHCYFNKSEADNGQQSIRGILVKQNKLYACLESFGLYEMDLSTRNVFRLSDNTGTWGYFGVSQASNGDLLSSEEKRFRRYSPDNRQKLLIKYPAGLWTTVEDRNGVLWMGSDGKGLYKMAPGSNEIEKFSRYNGFDAMAIAHIIYIQNTPSGRLWVCGSNGFYLVDPDKGVLARYWSGAQGDQYLPADRFHHFIIDKDGAFWMGTPTGLIKCPSKQSDNGDLLPAWNESGGQLWNRSNALPDDEVYAIYEDDRNFLWGSTNFGIFRLEKKSGICRAFVSADGISHTEFNRTAHFKDANGMIYFGSLNGITAFNPGDFFETPDTTDNFPLVVTAFQQFDSEKQLLTDRLPQLLKTKEIILSPQENYFNLEIALLSFEEVNKVQYSWKIDGHANDEWHYLRDRHFSYGGLPYGTHTLHIRARGVDGEFSRNEIVIKIRVLKPWYLQTWFILLSLGLVVAGVVYYNRRRNEKLIQEQKRLEGLVSKATERIEADKRTIEKQAEELRRLDEVKSRFFANVSHELRTPLTLLLGPIATVLKHNSQNNQDFTLLKLAQMHGKQLLQLVNQILDLSKLESGKLELHETPVLVYPYLRKAVASFESHAERQGIRFVFQSKIDHNLRIELDGVKLETILNNLLSNALKFTPSGGKINVQVENLGHALLITVEDTGRGIHPDDLPHIFNRFYQSGQPNAPTEGGTGIGLALCRELTDLMGGRIWAKSEGLQKGSRFFLELPVKEVLGVTTKPVEEEDVPEEEFLETPTVAMPDAPENSDRERATILIVEDNSSLRDYLKIILSGRYNVVTAENGQAALDIIGVPQSGFPDLIISDIMMPVMDGFQLLEQLKSIDSYRQIPVIMLTARAEMEDKLRALRIGVDDYLTKPFEEEELLARVGNLLLHQENRKPESVGEQPTANISQVDVEWLSELETWTMTNLKNDLMSVAEMARHAALSERQLQRRLRELTGLSPLQYITELRLQHARNSLEKGAYRTVSEVAYEAGFNDPKAFSKAYRERFGRLPSSYF